MATLRTGPLAARRASPQSDRVLFHVPHQTELLAGRLVDRYDRFIALVDLDDGRQVRAHCVNPGRMEGVVHPGGRVWLSPAPPERRRKLAFTWELLESDGVIVGANTVAPNRIAEALLSARVLPGLRRHRELRREVRRSGARVDFTLRQGEREHLLEVKNCHLVYPDGRGYFPDSRSERAARHMAHLAEEVAEGARASVLFVVQHPGARAVRPSVLHDPAFFEAARAAWQAGVRFRAVRVRPTLLGYDVLDELPVELRRYAPERLTPWREARLPQSGWRADPGRAR